MGDEVMGEVWVSKSLTLILDLLPFTHREWDLFVIDWDFLKTQMNPNQNLSGFLFKMHPVWKHHSKWPIFSKTDHLKKENPNYQYQKWKGGGGGGYDISLDPKEIKWIKILCL